MVKRPVRIPHFLLSFFLTLQAAGAYLFAQVQTDTGNFREMGWPIPGLTNLDTAAAFGIVEKTIGGIAVQETEIRPDANVGSGRNSGTLMVLISDKPIKKEMEVRLGRITKYSINGKPFCYLVSMVPASSDVTYLATMTFAYYDVEGNGLFQSREGVGPHPPPGDPTPYPVKLPEWVKKTAQKK